MIIINDLNKYNFVLLLNSEVLLKDNSYIIFDKQRYSRGVKYNDNNIKIIEESIPSDVCDIYIISTNDMNKCHLKSVIRKIKGNWTEVKLNIDTNESVAKYIAKRCDFIILNKAI